LNRSYAKGRGFEYRVKELFEKNGHLVIRAAASRPIDLVCMKDGEAILVECKVRGYLSEDERERIIEYAKRSGAKAMLATKKKRGLVLKVIE